MAEPAHVRSQALGLGAAIALVIPALVVRLGGLEPAHVLAAVLFGIAVVGAAFVLAWAAEAAQLDISAGLALALLALIAVLPEYAVDFVFTWRAGHDPGHWGPLALANMTGGNQLLIGAGWSLVVLLATARVRRARKSEAYEHRKELNADAINLERSHSIEIAFLVLATLYGLTLPLRRTLSLVDAVVLVAIFVGYVARITGAPTEEPHLIGPAELVGALPKTRRRIAVVAMFLFAAGVIILCADHFATALVATGHQFGISDFLLVKWLAPLASEAPELLVAGLYAWHLNANSGLAALVSSKVNQWTLLVGTLPIVFAISSGALHGLPLDSLQREELFVTAAQSAFAVAVLANRTINRREAWAMLTLFLIQLVLQGVLHGEVEQHTRIAVGVIYLMAGVTIVVQQRRALATLMRDGLTVSHAGLAIEA